MPPRTAVRGRPTRRNVEEQELPALEVQPQGEVTNDEFREAIRMLSQVVTNRVRQQREARQEGADTSRIHLENFIEELKKVFDVMHIADTERVELVQVEEEKQRDREGFRNKKAKTENESGQQKGSVNHSSL
ncbi:uncharacterized protein LOC125825192 [Solanum verrucosum]|uniref:uncharacterized protein LOC125825192 n=1 Tax=Solanum verrucosum TaxID=315347 RepID=UPI0020D19083|nr:uncharacterized protein LOC125825192 [Solanum verrucosum]